MGYNMPTRGARPPTGLNSMPSSRTNAATEPERLPLADPLAILVDASASLLASPRLSSVLPRILSVAKQIIAADAYAVWRASSGTKWSVAASEGMSESFQTELDSGIHTHTLLPGKPFLIPDVYQEPLVSNRREIYTREGIRSLVVLPLMLQNRPAGTLVFYFRKPRKEMTQAELTSALALANLAAAAISTAELYEQQMEEQRRFSYLAEISKVLASSLDYEKTLQRVADLTVPSMADGCNLYMIEGGRLRSVAFAVADATKRPIAEELSRDYVEQLRDDVGAGKLLRMGRPVLFPVIPEAVLEQFAVDGRQLELLRQLGMVSAISVPLFARGREIGVLRLATAESGRRFTERDVELAKEVGNRAAIAIDNARLHRELERAGELVGLTHEAASIGSWLWNLRQPEETWLSPEIRKLAGFPASWTPSLEAFEQLVHANDRQRVSEAIRTALSGSDSFSIEYRLVRFDGSLRWFESRGKVNRDAHGNPVSVFGITIDVTSRKEAEISLQEGEERYRFVTEALPIHVWYGEQGTIEYCNRHVLEFLGMSMEQVRAGEGFARIHPEDRQRVGEASARSFATRIPFRQEYRVMAADGAYHWVLAESRPFTDSKGRMKWLGTSIDITERKLADEALLRSEKLAATGRMAATIAHEINNPLEAVTNLVFLAENNPNTPLEVRASLQEADRQLQHMAHIVRQTLGFYRENAAPKTTPVLEFVGTVADLYVRKLAAKELRLKINVPKDLAIDVVAGEMRQVVANLLANAIDAAPIGGDVEIHAGRDQRSVYFAFLDSGPGVAQGEVGQLFQPFFTTKKEVGTGLGLWASRQIVEKHGGTITYSRDPLRGLTQFRVVLPNEASE